MSVCIVTLHVRTGAEDKLVEVFSATFRPAISGQPGFESVSLLRPPPAQPWLLEIRFADEAVRLVWVGTDLHQEVWPQIESLCEQASPTVYELAESC
jgi:heme-degrading monooxygenase HmoA